ncbi:MAG: hypothetical protein HOE11_01265 [Candidatus Diapherotrites archaeon]|jgi:hypothetical protein|nr:hypothetical protein [Candidatus Diapherotrites archaeon]
MGAFQVVENMALLTQEQRHAFHEIVAPYFAEKDLYSLVNSKALLVLRDGKVGGFVVYGSRWWSKTANIYFTYADAKTNREFRALFGTSLGRALIGELVRKRKVHFRAMIAKTGANFEKKLVAEGVLKKSYSALGDNLYVYTLDAQKKKVLGNLAGVNRVRRRV